LLVLGCEPAHPPPPGFEKECYGGNFKEHMDGNVPIVSVRIKATESDWPALATHMRAFARSESLVFFDTTLYLEHVHTLGLHVCSSDGVHIGVNEQHWKQGPFKGEFDPNHVYVRLYSYKNYPTEPLTESLVNQLKVWDANAAVE
jgi:hypothetical protein